MYPFPLFYSIKRMIGGDHMAATIEFQQAVGKVYFDGGLTDDGKLIRKSKMYKRITCTTRWSN